MRAATGVGQPGSVPSGAERFGAVRRWWRTLPTHVRRQVSIGSVVFAYVLVIGIGAYWNFTVYSTQTANKARIEAHERELARTVTIRADLQAQTHEGATLRALSDQLYAQLPDVAAVPVIVGQLEHIAAAVGGELLDIHYREPAWSGERGEVGIGIEFAGSFHSIQNYVASVTASVPSLHWRYLELEPVDKHGRDLLLFADISLDVLAARPADVAPWNDGQVQLQTAAAAREPFAIAVTVGAPMPELALHGVVQQNGRSLALLSVDGISHVVGVGQQIDALTVVQISAQSVLVRNGVRTAEIRLSN